MTGKVTFVNLLNTLSVEVAFSDVKERFVVQIEKGLELWLILDKTFTVYIWCIFMDLFRLVGDKLHKRLIQRVQVKL